jgi:RNA polymerase sigma factor (sigma-70 family)
MQSFALLTRPGGMVDVVRVSDGTSEVAVLVSRAAGGDNGAWNALVERYANLVWSVARAHRLGDDDAADVVQTTWLRLVENLGSLREPHRVSSWLITTARRESLRILKTTKREPAVDVSRLDRADQTLPDPDAALIEEERSAQLWSAFEQLGDNCRRLLRVLMATPPPSYEDVSAALDMPIGSIGPTRGRCLATLRKLAVAAGISEAAPGSA